MDPDWVDIDTVPHHDSGTGRSGELIRWLVLAALVAVVALSMSGRLGVRSAVSSARSVDGSFELTVEYARVTRPGLPTPFRIEVSSTDGEALPPEIGLRVDAAYLGIFDENGLDPEPDGATSSGDHLEWTFEVAPDTQRTTVDLDARLEPSVQSGRDGWVALVDDGVEVARVRFHTRVMP